MAAISCPKSVRPPSIIFRPLYSDGLCEPVTATPEPQPKWCVAKYSTGVGTMPISLTFTPAETIPRMSAPVSEGPDRRPSRPTHTVSMPLRTAQVPSTSPTARTTSSVRVLPTMPRMS